MKRFMKTLAVLMTLALAMVPLAGSSYADGSYSVDTTYLQLQPGQTGRITISADNAAGRVNWDSSGVVNESGSAFLDNGVYTIEFTANTTGTAYINIAPDPTYGIATYDNEELGYGYTVQVDVVGDTSDNDAPQEEPATQEPAQAPEEPTEEETTSQEIQEPTEEGQQSDSQEVEEDALMAAAEPETTVLTDADSDYSDLSEEDRLYTTVDGQELYIIQYPLWQNEDGDAVWNDEVFNLDRLNGFDYTTVNYKDMNVDIFTHDHMQVFVLKNLETDVSQYYVLGENGEGFQPLPYVTVNGRQYIVQAFPETFTIPDGYQKVEMTLGSSTVQALKMSDSGISLKGYNVLVSPGLDSADPSADLYYIYCLVDSQTQLYSYDSGEGTLQRAYILEYDEIPTEPETVIVTEPAAENPTPEAVIDSSSWFKANGWDSMQIQLKVLLIALAVAIVLIIILIIVAISLSHKNRKLLKKNRKKRNASREAIPPRKNHKDEDKEMFSYVKTESEDFHTDNLK